MSRHSQALYPLPEETRRIARAAFPRGNIYMQGADRLGPIYHDADAYRIPSKHESHIHTGIVPRDGGQVAQPYTTGRGTTAAILSAMHVKAMQILVTPGKHDRRMTCRCAGVVSLRTSTRRQMSGPMPRKTTRCW
jgi:transposase